MSLAIYTDGACLGNPGKGGWAYAVFKNGENINENSGFVQETTNNRMELFAVIKALESFRHAASLKIYTDSQYVKNGITLWIHNWKRNHWKTAQKKPVKNQDLWQKLDEQVKRHTVAWYWVKGHSSCAENNYVDGLAQKAAQGSLSVRNFS